MQERLLGRAEKVVQAPARLIRALHGTHPSGVLFARPNPLSCGFVSVSPADADTSADRHCDQLVKYTGNSFHPMQNNNFHAMQEREPSSREEKHPTRAAAAGNIVCPGIAKYSRQAGEEHSMNKNKRSSAIMACLKTATNCFYTYLQIPITNLG